MMGRTKMHNLFLSIMLLQGHMITKEYRTWENFGGGKFWRIWRMVSNSLKFSPPIFINTMKYRITGYYHNGGTAEVF